MVDDFVENCAEVTSNLCAKRCITFAKESMALPARNRPSPSVFQRLVAQELNCRSRAKVVDRSAPANRRAATVEKALKEIEEPRTEHARERRPACKSIAPG